MADEAMDVWYVNLLTRPPRRVCPNFGSISIGYHPVTENGEALARFRGAMVDDSKLKRHELRTSDAWHRRSICKPAGTIGRGDPIAGKTKSRSRSLMIRSVTKQEQGDPAKRNQQTNWHEDHEIRGNESLGSNDNTASQTNRTTPPNTGINVTRRRLRKIPLSSLFSI